MNKRRKMIAISAAMAFLTMAIAISVIAPSDTDQVEAAPTEIEIAPGMRYTYTPTYPSDLTVTTTIETQGIGVATNGTWGAMSGGTLTVDVPAETAPGTVYNVKLKAVSTNPSQTAYIEIKFVVTGNLTVSGSQANIVAGSAITMTPSASGMGTITWAVKGTLPAGLTLDPATGKVTGTPTGLGSKTISLTATTSYGETKDLNVTFSIVSVLAPTNSPTNGAIIYAL
jgi:hypothetical protein